MEDFPVKTASILAAALVAVSSFPMISQQTDATARQTTSTTTANPAIDGAAKTSNAATANSAGAKIDGSGSASGTTANSLDSAKSSAGASASGATDIRPVNAELVGKLDSKTARTGDRVVVKTTESMKTAEGAVIPKGSRLVGHVTSVQAHGSGSADSAMSIQFDRAELKSGQSMAIDSTIRSVAPPTSVSDAGSMDSDEFFGGNTRTAAGGRSRGGMLAGTAHATAASTERVSSGAGSTAGSATRATGHAATNSMASTGGKAHAAAGATNSVAAHPTGIPGVMLAGRASGSESGTLSASRRNVHLDSGTQMVLGVSAAATK
jgi:hypothetical protein